MRSRAHRTRPAPTTGHVDSRSFLYTLSAAIPLVLAGFIVWWHAHLPRPQFTPQTSVTLIRIQPASAEALQNMFSSQDYGWPPQDAVPPYAITSLPYGLGTLDSTAKKTVFFRALLPIVLAENQRILNERRFLLAQFGQGTIQPGTDAGDGVADLAARYRVTGNINSPHVRDTLLQRVDIVPVALVLAQAAQESGWGTSRFALEANNLFGIWTWDEDAGATPINRPGNASHFVRIYPDIQSSVRAYLHNINIGFAYHDFRTLRAQFRMQGKPLDALALAGTLSRYSTAGELYVSNIRSMIRGNDLGRLGKLVLAPRGE